MTRVHFLKANGDPWISVDADPDAVLLAVAQTADMPLEGTCEGQMACSTCHVIVAADDFSKLPRSSEAEEDMLDLAAHACRTSRLACQIRVGDAGETLTVRIPPGSHNMQGV